jgi:hypothetical protein
VNNEGFYKLRLCLGGRWVVIVVDDYMPCMPMGLPAVSYSSADEIWPSLIEKALAKSYQSFEALKDGKIEHALFDLTGFPVITYDLDSFHGQKLIDSDTLWST